MLSTTTPREVRTPLCGRPRSGCGGQYFGILNLWSWLWSLVSGNLQFHWGALLGDADVILLQRIHKFKPLAYAITKFTVRSTWISTATHGLTPVVPLRDVYGPRQIAEGGCGVTPIFREPLHDRYKLYAYEDMPDGCTRDYIYVGDVARANVIALDKGDNLISTSVQVRGVHWAGLPLSPRCHREVRCPLLPAGERVGDLAAAP